MEKKLLILLLSSSFLSATINYEGPSSENFIIRWAFQELCDHFYDPRKIHPTPSEDDRPVSFSPEDVRPGDIIFVRNFNYFLKDKYDQIKVPYFILTHGEFNDRFKKRYFKYLEGGNILSWFTIHPIDSQHERFVPLPIGTYPFKELWNNRSAFYEKIMRLRNCKKSKLVYRNFIELKMPERTRIRKLFENQPFVTQGKRCSFDEYLKNVAKHKFVLSPPGLGSDCYRVWECVMLGSIPIVQHSHMDEMYKGLPVLLIDRWEDITPEFLEQKYEEMTAQTYSQEKLFMEYWIAQIDEARKKYWPKEAGEFRLLGK